MSGTKRRFFSAGTLEAALVAAASEYGLPPEEIAYKKLEKKHGFLRIRRNVVIEVDPDAPQRKAVERPEKSTPAVGERVRAPEETESRAPVEKEVQAPEEVESRAPEETEGRAPEEVERRAPEEKEDRAPVEVERRAPVEVERRVRGTEQARDRRQPGPPVRPRLDLRSEEAEEEVERPAAVQQGARARKEAPRPTAAIEAPKEPRKEASGEEAEEAREAVEALLDLLDLDLDAHVFEGEERFEIELVGRDEDHVVEDGGELLEAMEHLVPRVMRGFSGRSWPVRVDCRNFHQAREEELRDLALRVAAEVAESGLAQQLEPLSPADRRIIHVTLADDPDVETESDGRGYKKRVRISPL